MIYVITKNYWLSALLYLSNSCKYRFLGSICANRYTLLQAVFFSCSGSLLSARNLASDKPVFLLSSLIELFLSIKISLARSKSPISYPSLKYFTFTIIHLTSTLYNYILKKKNVLYLTFQI